MKFTITYSTALVATLQLVSASNPFNKATNQLGGGAGLLEGRATGSVSSVERRVEEEDVNTYDADGCAVKECINTRMGRRISVRLNAIMTIIVYPHHGELMSTRIRLLRVGVWLR